MFWGFFLCNLGELPEKTISPRLTLLREIGRGKRNPFYYCKCVYGGSTGEESKKWKIQKRLGNISKTSSFFHCLKGTLPRTNLPRCLSFSFFVCFVFFPRNPFSSLWLRPKAMSLSAPSMRHIAILNTYLISASTGGSFALSHSSISGPAGSAESPHQEGLIITVIVFTLSLPRTCPHLNHYLFPHTINLNCHNQGVSICFCLFSLSRSTVFHFFILLNPMSGHSSRWGKAGE